MSVFTEKNAARREGRDRVGPYRVQCPDRCVRHEGVFHDRGQADHYAAEPRCCRLGRHIVVRAEALRGVA